MKFPEYPTVTCYTPKGFDATKLPNYNKRHHYKYDWSLHTLLLKHLRSSSKFDEPVSLSGKVLQELFGSVYYPMIIKSLMDGKVITRFNYRAGEHAFKYKINPHILKEGIQAKQIDKVTIRRKIHLFRDKDIQRNLKDAISKHEFQNLTFIDIDVEDAIKFINSKYKEGTPKHTHRILSVYEVSRMKDTQTAEGIIKMDWMFKVDRSGRWHTPIAHLAKDLRPFLKTIDGKRFVELDGACSQLTFCHKYLLEHVSEKVSNSNIIGEGGTPTDSDNEYEPQWGLDGPKPMGRGSLPSYDVRIDLMWRNAIFNGNAYQLLMDGMQWKKSRDEFKEYFFKNLFFNKYRPKLTKMEEAFKHYFPYEFQRLRKTKKRIGNKELAVAVQRYESRFWHKWIGSSMREKFKLINYATIHDSIILPEENVNEVMVEVIRQAIRFFNPYDSDEPLIPTFRVKTFEAVSDRGTELNRPQK